MRGIYMTELDIVDIGLFLLQTILAILGSFSILAKATPWDDEALAKRIKDNPEPAKKWLTRAIKIVNLLGLTKRNK